MDKEDLEELAKKHDEKWDELMAIAKENGFVVQAFGGTATMITNKNQIENYGYEEYQKIQEMNDSLEKINDKEL